MAADDDNVQEIAQRLASLTASTVDADLEQAFLNPDPNVGPVPDQLRGFRVRVDLVGAQPPVWRQLEVPGDLTLPQVHIVIQTAMGWTDSHLHRFSTGDDHRAPYFITGFDVEEGEEGVLEDDVRLDQVVADEGDRLWYDYDFGDGWSHQIAVEAVLDEAPAHVVCLAGRLACPPEDCGGIGGYSDLAEWVRGGCAAEAVPPPFESKADALRWLPPGWHPDDFSVPEVNAALETEMAEPVPVAGELAELMDDFQHRGLRTLRQLLSQPVWREPHHIDDDDLATMLAPLATLLDLVRDGVKLTGAGYLAPALVEQLAERTGVSDWWIGKANREDLTVPIHQLRATAQALGLVSVRKGVLQPVTALRKTADHQAIWRRLISRLPLGRDDFDRQAGWTELVIVGSGAPVERWGPDVSEALSGLGWQTSAGPGFDLPLPGNPTGDVLRILAGQLQDRRLSGDHPAVAATARAAVAKNSA